MTTPAVATAAKGPSVTVIGAGLAGLAAAVALTRAGQRVRLLEATDHAGGRCRSFHDPVLDRLIDNGTHLLLSGNTTTRTYLEALGQSPEAVLTGPDRARLPFLDLASGERWTLALSPGPLPWWILDPHRRPAGTRAREFLSGLRLLTAGPNATVADLFRPGTPLYARFWEPLAVAVLNTHPNEAAAALLRPVIAETFARGEAACRPRLARAGLSAALVDPALAFLAERGAEVAFGHRVQALEAQNGRISALRIAQDARLPLAEGETVILAVPPQAAARLLAPLLPDLPLPTEARAIINVHYRLDGLSALPPADPQAAPLGLLGGVGEWLSRRGDVASVTLSAADPLLDTPPEDIAARVWREVAQALGLPPAAPTAPPPPFRVIKERRATFAQTPDQVRRRPQTRTPLANLLLAGDWTDTGLPATIEGALRSGFRASDCALHHRST